MTPQKATLESLDIMRSRYISLWIWQPTQSQQLLLFKYRVVIQFYLLFQAPHPCLHSPPLSQPARRHNPHRISGQPIKLLLYKPPYLMHQACSKKRGKALLKHRSVYIFLSLNHTVLQSCGSKIFFFGSGSNVSDCFGSCMIFSNIFYINLTFVSPSCNLVRLHISAHFHLLS
jgi:hypothetical protein